MNKTLWIQRNIRLETIEGICLHHAAERMEGGVINGPWVKVLWSSGIVSYPCTEADLIAHWKEHKYLTDSEVLAWRLKHGV
jgi:hypothetical protein